MKPHLSLQAGVSVVYAGNSLMHATQAYLTTSAPVAGSGCTTTNCAVPGQNWTQMRTNAAAITAALAAAGEFVVVPTWETTNQINGGSSVNTCISEALLFIDMVRSIRADARILMIETIPREGVNSANNTVEGFNAKLQQCDEFFLVNAKKYDLEFVTLRTQDSPFNLPRFDTAAFDSASAYWAPAEAVGTRTHLSTTVGYPTVAREIRKALYRLKAR